MSDTFTLTPVRHLVARLVTHEWAWAADNRDDIARNWARRRAASPAIFDGRVLLACACRIAGDICTIDLFEAPYSCLIAFRDAGSPDPAVTNAFAAIVPWSADGAAVLGIMGAHTANGGQAYFPCGTPDRNDIRASGTVDLAGSAAREFREETGIVPAPDAPGNWVLVSGQSQSAFLRPVHFPDDAETLLTRMEAHRRAETDPELAGFLAVRGPDEIDADRMPGFVRAYLIRAFAGGPFGAG